MQKASGTCEGVLHHLLAFIVSICFLEHISQALGSTSHCLFMHMVSCGSLLSFSLFPLFVCSREKIARTRLVSVSLGLLVLSMYPALIKPMLEKSIVSKANTCSFCFPLECDCLKWLTPSRRLTASGQAVIFRANLAGGRPLLLSQPHRSNLHTLKLRHHDSFTFPCASHEYERRCWTPLGNKRERM